MRLPQSSTLLFRLISTFTLVWLSGVLAFGYSGGSQQLRSSPSNLSFGAVEVSQSLAQTVTLTNSGKTSATVSALTASNSAFSVSGITLPVVLAAGQTVKAIITFTPASAGWNSANVTVTSTASNTSLKIGVQGNAVSNDPLTAAPSSLSFGNVAVGSKSTLSVVVTNGQYGKVILTSYQTSGTGFTVTGPSMPLTLAHGQSATLNATFAPTASGSASGSVFLPGPGLTVSFSGTGTSSTTGQLTVSPASLSFGNVDIGSSGAQTSTISATGGTVTVNSAASSSSLYAITGAAFPLTLNSGQSAQLTISFAPTTSGTSSATLTYTTSTSVKSTESATGTGVSPQYTVNLSWNASTSSVSGYNVYRGTTSGVYTKINSSLDPGTSYADNTVATGTTYYYAATSVNSSGQESTYSSPIQVAIP